jgi:hypothetical protein
MTCPDPTQGRTACLQLKNDKIGYCALSQTVAILFRFGLQVINVAL